MKVSLLNSIWRRALAPLFFVAAIFAANADSISAQTGNAAADRQLQMWRGFSPPNGGFSVSLPAQPEGGSSSVEKNNVSLEYYGYESKSGGSTYTIVHLDFPAAAKDADEEAIEDSFDRGRETILQKKSAVLMNEKKITAFGYPAREFTMQDGANQTRVQMILTKQRLFIVACTTPALRNMPEVLTKVYQAESDKFFNSFEILDNKKAVVNGKR